MNRHRRPRKPFDWLGERKQRRGALNLIRQAIREGWLDGPEHGIRRDQLVASLSRMLNIEHMPTPDGLSLCRTFLAMARKELENELDSLRIEHDSHQSDAAP